MTAVLMFVVGMAIIAGLVWVMMRMQRSHRQLIERRREEWQPAGASGRGAGPWRLDQRRRRRDEFG
jgi:hypothetical protein